MNKYSLLFLGIIVIYLHSVNTTNLRGVQQTMQPDNSQQQKIELLQENQLVNLVQVKTTDGESKENDGESGEVKNFWNWIFGGIDSEESSESSTEESDGEGNFFERLFDGDFFSYVETREIPELIQVRDGESKGDGEDGEGLLKDLTKPVDKAVDWVVDGMNDLTGGVFSFAQTSDGEVAAEEDEEEDQGFIDWIIDKLTFWDNNDGEDSLLPDIGIDGEILPDVPVPNPLDAVDGEIIPDIVFTQKKSMCKDPVSEKWGTQVYNKNWSGKWKFNKAGDVFGVQYNSEFLALAKFDSEGNAYLLFENNEACKSNLTNFVNVKLSQRSVQDVDEMTQEQGLEYISLLNDQQMVLLATSTTDGESGDVFNALGGVFEDDGEDGLLDIDIDLSLDDILVNPLDGEFDLLGFMPDGELLGGIGGVFEDGFDVLGDGFDYMTDGEGIIGGVGGFLKDGVETVGDYTFDAASYVVDGEDGLFGDVTGVAGDAFETVSDGEVVGAVTGTVSDGANAVADTASDAAGSVTDGELVNPVGDLLGDDDDDDESNEESDDDNESNEGDDDDDDDE